MADLPPDNDDGAPNYPESPFLLRLWDHIEVAADLSVREDVLQYLDEIVGRCQAAIDEIRAWRQGDAR